MTEVKQLLTMARENPSWGYTPLRGALENLGFDLGRSTIQRILTEHGIEPAPLRGKTMPWKTFCDRRVLLPNSPLTRSHA